MASECVARTTSCCCYATDTLASCALTRRSSRSGSGRPRTRERLQAIQLTSASLCLLREMPCATLHSVVSVHTDLHLSPLSSACSCASTSCRSSSHCVSWLSESSTSMLSANVLSLSPHSVTGCISSRHRGQLSVVVEAVTNSSRSDLVFTEALLSCVPGPQETAQTTRLVLTSSILRGD